MMRFVFLDWTHAHYETLDARLQSSALCTRRYILPEHEGILVASGDERAPGNAELVPPRIAPSALGRRVPRDLAPAPAKMETPAGDTGRFYGKVPPTGSL